MIYPIDYMRTMFNIAKDVKDEELQKAMYEADRLDVKPQIDMVYSSVPTKYLTDTDQFTGLNTIISYYANARYMQTCDQKSTSTGMKIQTYGQSIIVPDTSKNKRFEAEREKADIFMCDLIKAMRDNKDLGGCGNCNDVRFHLIH